MPATKRRVERAAQRSAERALREERLALAALTKVMLLEVPDPRRVLARLEAMCRAAEENPRTTAATRKMLLDGTRFVRTAIERDTARPQTLFDPHVGHIKKSEVDKLVTPTEGEQQLGLINHESTLGDVEAAHTDRVDTIAKAHSAIVEIVRANGPLTDRQLHGHYITAATSNGWPWQSQGALTERRKELTNSGRLAAVGNGAWDLIERTTT